MSNRASLLAQENSEVRDNPLPKPPAPQVLPHQEAGRRRHTPGAR
jgi:hypothetical protein